MESIGNLGGTIYYKDIPIISFKFERGSIKSISELNKDCPLLPFEFEGVDVITSREIINFFDERITPPTRIGINEDLAKTPVKYYDAERLIRWQSGRCIHDPYWLKCDDDTYCWDKLK